MIKYESYRSKKCIYLWDEGSIMYNSDYNNQVMIQTARP